MPRGIAAGVGGELGRCVWQGGGGECCRCRVMGHYSRAIDFITVSLTYPSLTLSKCPCQPLIHLIPWLSILTAFGQKGQYFFPPRVPELCNTHSGTEAPASSTQRQQDGNMMYCNHTLPVGFIKFSWLTHSQARCERTHKKVCISSHEDRGGAWTHCERISALATNTHFPPSLLSLARLFDEIEVAMPWVYAEDTRTSVSPRGDAI